MTRCPPYGDPSPVDALFTDVDDQLGIVTRSEVQASGFGNDIVGVDRVSLVLGEPDRTRAGVRLFVRDAKEDEVPARPEAAVGEMADRYRHRRREIQHVYRAPAPDLVVDDLPAERVVSPFILGNRDHVGVAHQREARSCWIRAFDSCDHGSSAW